jgi:hypothetical protein
MTKNKTFQKANNTNANSLTILDLDTGEFTEVSHEQIRLAQYAHQQVLLGVFISAISLKKIFDEKLYLALNCQSKEEYCSTLPFGLRQAEKLCAIAAKFENVSKSLTGNGLIQITSGDTLENAKSTSPNEIAEKVSNLGIEKLYELSRFDDGDLAELIKKGKVKVGENDFNIEDIKDETAKELGRQISEATKKYKSKIAVLTEENKLLIEQKEATEKNLDKLNKRKEELEDIELKYGPVASSAQAKRKALEQARNLLENFNEVIIRCGITPEDPEVLRKLLQGIIRETDEVHERLLTTYVDAITE